MQQFQQGFADMFKAFGDFTPPAFDFNSLFAAQRRNMEALSAANQIVTENAQALSRQQAESLRENVEAFLQTSRDILTSSSPEDNTSRQAEFTRAAFDASLSNLRDTLDSMTKSQFEAFELLQQRAAENFEEINTFTRKAAA